MSSASMEPDAKARLAKVLGLAALSDIVVGIVLILVGFNQDNEPLAIAGLVLAGAGLAVGTWAAVQRGKPIQL